ncbi:acyl carrier protein [Longispora urticae]
MTHQTQNSDTAALVLQFVADLHLTDGPPEADTALDSIDSIQVLRLITRIEDHYGILLDSPALFQASTVDELIAIVDDSRRTTP